MKKSKSVYERIRKPTAPPTKVIQSRADRLKEKEDLKAIRDAEWERDA